MYSPVHTLISILLIYSVTDAYMYVMYLVFENFHLVFETPPFFMRS